MCGIWGVISVRDITKEQIKSWYKLFESIKPRGPDKSTVTHIGKVVYGFHRLAIHDLTPLGDQPFIFYKFNKLYLLQANGEIYNYKELAEKYDLVKDLKSDSDCEIIAHLYFKFKSIEAVAKELRGEFAFALTEISDGFYKTYLCRDPIGVRPLFYSFDRDGGNLFFASTLSGVIDGSVDEGKVFPPGNILEINEHTHRFKQYYQYDYKFINTVSSCARDLERNSLKIPSSCARDLERNSLKIPSSCARDLERNSLKIPSSCARDWEITSRLINAVKVRLDSDRPIGALLSGGLDSSLVCAIASKLLGYTGLRTFSIGMSKGTDLEYAKKVSEHLGTSHTEVFFTPEEGLKAIDQVLQVTETWDITTIRASVGQLLLGRYISSNTDIKVILNGDGADEVEMGYLYFYLAPDAKSAQEESVKLVKQIHRFDGLRVDRCISSHGLEARLPFLDQDFVDYYMQIDPELKIPTTTRMEKQLIRDAFDKLYPNILPQEVLYRKKEAFSDGVSSKEKSWFELITEWIETKVPDKEFEMRDMNYYSTCKSKESYYYRKRFNELFNKTILPSNDVIPHYWLPNWVETNGEPSARVLQVYK
jgi:asparagine synthase (glutamine-hydrolysing)